MKRFAGAWLCCTKRPEVELPLFSQTDLAYCLCDRYHRFKLYALRMLATLDITGASVAQPLLAATDVIRDRQDIPSRSVPFLQPRSKWRGHLRDPETNRDRLWVVAVLFHLREAFRSGDVWLAHSRRYSDLKQALVPVEAAQTMGLSMPLEKEVWLADRKQRLEDGLHRLAKAVRNGTLPGGIIEDGRLRVERLEADVPAEADNLILDLYRRLPEARITDILMDVANETGFTDALRCIATMLSGRMQPSQLLKKLAARPRPHDLAIALREIGRIERTLFIIDWLLDTDMQRRAQIGLNKGEAHHALKNALRIGRQGEIRDCTTEGQHFRIAGLNLLTAIIIYWNTKQLGFAVAARQKAGLDTPAYLLSHISSLGWAHIILTGEYRWRQMAENP